MFSPGRCTTCRYLAVVLRSLCPMRRCSVEISQPERIISVAKHARSTWADSGLVMPAYATAVLIAR